MFKLNRITLSIRWAINFNYSSPSAIDSAEDFYVRTGMPVTQETAEVTQQSPTIYCSPLKLRKYYQSSIGATEIRWPLFFPAQRVIHTSCIILHSFQIAANCCKLPYVSVPGHPIVTQKGWTMASLSIEKRKRKTGEPTYRAIVRVKKNKKIIVNLAINYGSKNEILLAFKKTKKILNIINFEKNLYTKRLPHPDILIRTGGHQRLSNFMLWQLAYAELFFLKKLWPDFSENDLKKIINKFKKSKRNFGSI